VTQHIWIAQTRWDPGLLRVPQDLAKQTGLGDCLPGGLGRPKHDGQAGGQLGPAGVAGKSTQGAPFQPQ
jgi:hypothetical protein